MPKITTGGNAKDAATNSAVSTEQPKNNPAPVNQSIADLYASMESKIETASANAKTGVTAEIRNTVEGIFEATGKDKLLFPAVVKICEQQLGKKKLYNLVRSVAQAKTGKFNLVTAEGRSYIVLKE